MQRVCILLFALALCAGLASPAATQSDKIQYIEKYEYPVFTEMEEYADSIQALRDSVTAEILERRELSKKAEEKQKRMMLLDFADIKIPTSPDVFDTVFYFPPVAQYMSGTCWAFAGTSFLESEAARLTGTKVKLSEIFTVYWEYVEKARRFAAERGDSRFSQGGEALDVIYSVGKYGTVPLETYTGLPDPGYDRHHHWPMANEIDWYLDFIKENELWSEDQVIAGVKIILDRHLGTPPTSFTYQGKSYTPRQFATDVLGLKAADYVSVMSTLSVPFYTRTELKAYDNWRRDSSYFNLPLDVWYATLKNAIRDDYSLTIGLDISEPGFNGFVDAAVVPDYDIPRGYINQHSREFRIYNETTTDDHGMHLVGYTKLRGHDWYLLKDSASRGRYGQFKGYMFLRGDYVKLKILTFTAHKQVLGKLLDKFAEEPATAETTAD